MTKKISPKPVPSDFQLEIIGDHFLEIARYFREIQDSAPEQLVPVARLMGIGQRKAYALARIDRSFHDLGVERDRLRRMGWTRLAMLSPFVTGNNVEQLLKLASETTVYELQRILQGKDIDPEGKVMVLYLRQEDLAVFDQVLEAYGATRHRRGWLGKEDALTKALARLIETAG